jgi:hypothetical protein
MSRRRKLTAFEQEWHERQARSRAAWGLYAACVRQGSFDRELERQNREVRSSSGESRTKAEKKREKFIEEAKTQNARGFWVG